mmetsp:Transcript_25626/g.28510  ORF Transcript_25626/g.28510 Transcript_25626/m.28510 type:complete len:112 (+) Transcript_25626:180-515(+)
MQLTLVTLGFTAIGYFILYRLQWLDNSISWKAKPIPHLEHKSYHGIERYKILGYGMGPQYLRLQSIEPSIVPGVPEQSEFTPMAEYSTRQQPSPIKFDLDSFNNLANQDWD